MKILWSSLLLSVLSVSLLAAEQTEFERFKAKRQQAIDQQKQNFEQYRANQQAAFVAYKTKMEQALAQALEEDWKRMELYKAKRNPLKPKPVSQPTFTPDKGSSPAPQTQPVQPVAPDVPAPGQPKLTMPDTPLQPTPTQPTQPTLPIQAAPKLVAVDFYGVSLQRPDVPSPVRQPGANQQQIAGYFQQQPDYEDHLRGFFADTRKTLHLDDWASYLLVSATAAAVYPGDPTHQKLATWKWLNQQAYDIRIATSAQGLILLIPISVQVYGMGYLDVQGRKYYLVGGSGYTNIRTYDQQVAGLQPMQLFHPTQTNWTQDKDMLQSRNMEFKYAGQQHRITIQYDSRTVKLLNDYPQFAFDYYFSLPLSRHVAEGFRSQFVPLLAGKSIDQQANLLLAFVQSGLQYKTDKEQFGRENYLSIEETFAYPFADCEDRSFLYARLVHNLLDVDYIGLMYPNHLSTAVAVPSRGKQVTYKSRQYTIADPTYIGASLGDEMPTKNSPQVVYASNLR